MESKDDPKIRVGVDFGTTSTGVAFSGPDNKVIPIRIGPPGYAGLKFPSRTSYTGNQTPPLVGFEVRPGMQAYTWTKLLLDPSMDHNEFNDKTLEALTASGILKLPDGLDAATVVTDFLREIYRHIRIRLRQVRKVDPGHVPIEFWFTFPAIWPEEVRSLLCQLAMNAGFGSRPLHRVLTISEPEAAALTVLNHVSYFDIKPHDGLLVCDCGGGTVDTTAYYITDIVPSVNFEQLTTATGAKCGGTAVDTQFYKFISIKLGEELDSLPPFVFGPGSELMNDFEEIKRNFHGGESEVYQLRLDISAPNADPSFFDKERRVITLRSQDLRGWFDPVITRILSLILSQITAPGAGFKRRVINKVVLVGGFSQSRYLQDSLRRSLQQVGDIRVLVPQNPEAAVTYGAVLQGLLGYSRPTHKCCQHYGLASVHPLHFTHESGNSSITRSHGIPQSVICDPCWVLNKDQRYATNFSQTLTINIHHWEHDLLVKAIAILGCNLPTAPQNLNNPGVYEIDYIECHFTGLNLARFPHRIIAGRMVYHLEVLVQVSLTVPNPTMHFVASALGQEIGRKDLAMARE